MRFSYWLWFSIIISFTPLLWSLWDVFYQNNSLTNYEGLTIVISNGELIIVCVPILSAAIGEIFKSGVKKTEFECFTIGGALFAIATSAYIYASILSSQTPRKIEEIQFIFKSSFILLCATVFISFSAFCISKFSRTTRFN